MKIQQAGMKERCEKGKRRASRASYWRDFREGSHWWRCENSWGFEVLDLERVCAAEVLAVLVAAEQMCSWGRTKSSYQRKKRVKGIFGVPFMKGVRNGCFVRGDGSEGHWWLDIYFGAKDILLRNWGGMCWHHFLTHVKKHFGKGEIGDLTRRQRIRYMGCPWRLGQSLETRWSPDSVWKFLFTF